MKRIPFLLILAASVMLFNNCKDDDPYPKHCYNEVIDGDEEGLNCGGSCPDCSPEIKWENYTDWPNPRTFIAAELFDDLIYISGGGANLGLTSNIVEAFDPSDQSWSLKGSLSTTRIAHEMVKVGDALYVMGGAQGPGIAAYGLTSIEKYDKTNNEWKVMPNVEMNPGRMLFGACELNGKIYMIGGRTGLNTGNDHSLATVQVFDPQSGELNTLEAELNVPRWALEVVVWDGKIYAIGGGEEYSFSSTIEVYDPAKPQDGWQLINGISLNDDRGLFASSVLFDWLYCFGGANNAQWYPNSITSNSVDIFSPKEISVSPTAPMAKTRQGLASCVWQNQIFIFGGVEKANLNEPAIGLVERGVLE